MYRIGGFPFLARVRDRGARCDRYSAIRALLELVGARGAGEEVVARPEEDRPRRVGLHADRAQDAVLERLLLALDLGGRVRRGLEHLDQLAIDPGYFLGSGSTYCDFCALPGPGATLKTSVNAQQIRTVSTSRRWFGSQNPFYERSRKRAILHKQPPHRSEPPILTTRSTFGDP